MAEQDQFPLGFAGTGFLRHGMKSRVDFGPVVGQVGDETRNLPRAQAAPVVTQIQGEEPGSVVDPELGQFLLEEVVGPSVDVEHVDLPQRGQRPGRVVGTADKCCLFPVWKNQGVLFESFAEDIG